MVFFYVIVCVCVCVCVSFNETASDDFLLRQLYLYADMLFCVRHILSFPLFSLLLFPPFSVRAPQSGCTCTKLSYSDSFFFFCCCCCVHPKEKEKQQRYREEKKKSSRYFIFSCCCCLFVCLARLLLLSGSSSSEASRRECNKVQGARAD